MKEFNLQRLIDASPFTQNLTDDQWNGVFDFFNDLDFTLESINIDDFIVNGTTIIGRKEYQQMSEEEREDLYILSQDDDELFTLAY
ncbi:MAG TPA: hypothetical protein DCR48_02655 [Flavobacteriales bacterium]|nr:hypothetical protein [Flavobacteriales bacterium]